MTGRPALTSRLPFLLPVQVFDAKRLIGRSIKDPSIQDDIRRFPFIEKKDLRDRQEAVPPFGDIIAVPERDIVYKVIANGKNPMTTKLSSVMSRPLKVIKASDRVESAASALRANKIKRLPVVDRKGKLVGIVTEGDLLRVYPGMIDVVSEMQEIRRSKPNEYYTGTCDICGCFSEELRRDEGKLKCEECIEEDEV